MKLPEPYYADDLVTLYHGDARELLPLLDDASIDLILTDPPYGHNNNNNDLAHRWEAALGIRAVTEEEARPILNDGPEQAAELIELLAIQSKRLLRPGGCCCCCGGGGGPDPQFARWSLVLDRHLDFKQMVVWDKGGLGMGWHYRRNYEVVLVANKGGAKVKWFGGNAQANVIRIGGIKPRQHDHPTPKPVALMQQFVQFHSEPGDLVLDPFTGGGTTLVAAKNLGRRAIGFELDEQWCNLTAERLAQETLGLTA